MNSNLRSDFTLLNQTIKPQESKILRPDSCHHVHPKAMDVLVCLARNPGRVISRQDILDQVWGHEYGTDKGLTRCISELRHALGDVRGANRFIETIPKRGYRLIPPVTVDAIHDVAASAPLHHRSGVESDTHRDAYDYVVRGRELAWLHKRDTGIRARRLLDHAISLDASCAAAYSWLAFTHLIEHINGWSEDTETGLVKALTLAEKAVNLDHSNAEAHFVLGEVMLWLREHDRAADHAQIAIEQQPGYAHARLLLGHVLHYIGRAEDSLEHFKAAIRLDPCYPDLYLHFLAQSHYSLEQYQSAIVVLEERIARNGTSDISHVLMAACLGKIGEKMKAQESWDMVQVINRDYSLEHRRQCLPYENTKDFDHMVDGLSRAGIPV